MTKKGQRPYYPPQINHEGRIRDIPAHTLEKLIKKLKISNPHNLDIKYWEGLHWVRTHPELTHINTLRRGKKNGKGEEKL